VLVARKFVGVLKVLGEFFLDYITHIIPRNSQLILECVDELQRIINSVEVTAPSLILHTQSNVTALTKSTAKRPLYEKEEEHVLLPPHHVYCLFRKNIGVKRLINVFRVTERVVPFAVFNISMRVLTNNVLLKKEIRQQLSQQGEGEVGVGLLDEEDIIDEYPQKDGSVTRESTRKGSPELSRLISNEKENLIENVDDTEGYMKYQEEKSVEETPFRLSRYDKEIVLYIPNESHKILQPSTRITQPIEFVYFLLSPIEYHIHIFETDYIKTYVRVFFFFSL
jgi:hypothetical protein